jgi:hypothetical protein
MASEARPDISGLESLASVSPEAIEAFRSEMAIDPSITDDQMFSLGIVNPRFELAVLGMAREARDAGLDPEQASITTAAFIVGILRRKAQTDSLIASFDVSGQTLEPPTETLLASGA